MNTPIQFSFEGPRTKPTHEPVSTFNLRFDSHRAHTRLLCVFASSSSGSPRHQTEAILVTTLLRVMMRSSALRLESTIPRWVLMRSIATQPAAKYSHRQPGAREQHNRQLQHGHRFHALYSNTAGDNNTANGFFALAATQLPQTTQLPVISRSAIIQPAGKTRQTVLLRSKAIRPPTTTQPPEPVRFGTTQPAISTQPTELLRFSNTTGAKNTGTGCCASKQHNRHTILR